MPWLVLWRGRFGGFTVDVAARVREGVNVSSEEVPVLPSALSVQPQPPQQRSLFVYVVVLLQY